MGINPVIEDGCIHPRPSARENLITNFFADTNHGACRAVNRLRYASTPFSGVALHLPGRKGIQAVDSHHEGYLQLPAEQRSGVAARESRMRVDHIHWMRTVQTANLRKQAGEKKSPRSSRVPIPREARKNAPIAPERQNRRSRRHLDRRAARRVRCSPLPTAPATTAVPRQSNPGRRLPARDRTESRSARAAVSVTKTIPRTARQSCGARRRLPRPVFRDSRSRNISSHRRTMGSQSNCWLCLRPGLS